MSAVNVLWSGTGHVKRSSCGGRGEGGEFKLRGRGRPCGPDRATGTCRRKAVGPGAGNAGNAGGAGNAGRAGNAGGAACRPDSAFRPAVGGRVAGVRTRTESAEPTGAQPARRVAAASPRGQPVRRGGRATAVRYVPIPRRPSRQRSSSNCRPPWRAPWRVHAPHRAPCLQRAGARRPQHTHRPDRDRPAPPFRASPASRAGRRCPPGSFAEARAAPATQARGRRRVARGCRAGWTPRWPPDP